MRGENLMKAGSEIYGTGTSPRARGKRLQNRFLPKFLRNIPACAGKTNSLMMFSLLNQEHPRVRGENPGISLKTVYKPGTSPRARGKRLGGLPIGWFPRNIPACAGKTAISVLAMAFSPEHPRVRGENPQLRGDATTHNGTSPRARGKRHRVFDKHFRNRNIPACAGKT